METEKKTNFDKNEGQDIQSNNDLNNGIIFKNKDSKIGPMIGSIIIILIIIIGGIYFWGKKIEERRLQVEKIKQINLKEENTFDPDANPVEEANNIDKELKDLNLDELDRDLDAIDKEFDSI